MGEAQRLRDNLERVELVLSRTLIANRDLRERARVAEAKLRAHHADQRGTCYLCAFAEKR